MRIFILDTKRAWSLLLRKFIPNLVIVENPTTFDGVQDGDVIILHSGDTSTSELAKLLNLSPIRKIRIGFVSGGSWPPRPDRAQWGELAAKYPVIKLEGCDYFGSIDDLRPTIVAKFRLWLRKLMRQQRAAEIKALREIDCAVLAKCARVWREVLFSCIETNGEVNSRGTVNCGNQVPMEIFAPLTKPGPRGYYLPEMCVLLEGTLQNLKAKSEVVENFFPEELVCKRKMCVLPTSTPNAPFTVEDITRWLRDFQSPNHSTRTLHAKFMDWDECRALISFSANTIAALAQECEVPFERRRWWLNTDQSRSVIWHDSLTKNLIYRLIDGTLQANLVDLEAKFTRRDEVLLKNLPSHNNALLNRNFAFGLKQWFGKEKGNGIAAAVRKLLVALSSPPSELAMRLSKEGKTEIATACESVKSIDAFLGALHVSKRNTAQVQPIPKAEQWGIWEACFQLVRFHDKSRGFLAQWKRNFERTEFSHES